MEMEQEFKSFSEIEEEPAEWDMWFLKRLFENRELILSATATAIMIPLLYLSYL